MYTNEDLVRLQNILALKFLGFSLEEIKALLQTGPKRLEAVLAQQRALMEAKRVQLETIIQAIGEAEQLLQANRCTWESITRVIQVIQMSQENTDWTAKYFTPEQRQTMEELNRKASTPESRRKLAELHPGEWTEADQQRIDEQYRFVKQELGRLVALNTDPASPEAQEVARVKSGLSFGFTQGDPDLVASVGKWWQEFDALPEGQKPFDMALYTYTTEEQDLLGKALSIYEERQGNA